MNRILTLAACLCALAACSEKEAAATSASIEASVTPPSTTTPAAPDWEYHERNDDMRQIRHRWAVLTSENSVVLPMVSTGEPTKLQLVIDDNKSVELMINIGAFACDPGDTVAVKVGSSPVASLGCEIPNGAIHNLYIDSASINEGVSSLADEISHSNKITIEASFFMSPPRQFTFSTAGLNYRWLTS